MNTLWTPGVTPPQGGVPKAIFILLRTPGLPSPWTGKPLFDPEVHNVHTLWTPLPVLGLGSLTGGKRSPFFPVPTAQGKTKATYIRCVGFAVQLRLDCIGGPFFLSVGGEKWPSGYHPTPGGTPPQGYPVQQSWTGKRRGMQSNKVGLESPGATQSKLGLGSPFGGG